MNMRSVPCAHPTAIRDPSLDTARQDTSPERERGGGRDRGREGGEKGERREGGREGGKDEEHKMQKERNK